MTTRWLRAQRIGGSAFLLWVALTVNSCAGGHHLAPQPMVFDPVMPPVAWFRPQLSSDTSDLSRWRSAVGPPAIVTGTTTPAGVDRLVVVNWNVHVGGGDIPRLFADVRAANPSAAIVFLLQEAYREGPEVPSALDRSAAFASVIRGLRRDGTREEVEEVARDLGLHAYYVPSMRNGPPGISTEDRGNAILSTLPLTDLSAIELPFERQRRVAVAGTLRARTPDGRPWQLRVVSAHLDNLSSARRLWIVGSEFARARQARGLLSAIDTGGSLVLGGDLNTLFGFRDSAYREIARAFPDTLVTDRRATFQGVLRLDHLFFRLPDGWNATFRRADDDYGSDHHPLVGVVSVAN